MHPAASNRALIRRRSFATSLPGAWSARTRWSGPRGCRAGSGPATFRAWSPADQPHPPSRTPVARRPMRPAAIAGGALSADLAIWPSLGAPCVLVIGHALRDPGALDPATSFYRWIGPCGFTCRDGRTSASPASPSTSGTCLHRYRRPDLLGIGRSLLLLCNTARFPFRPAVLDVISDGSPRISAPTGSQLPLAFYGTVWAYLGWQVLLYLRSSPSSAGPGFTAWMRWICRNIKARDHEVLFIGCGLEFLWRSIVFGIGCLFIIPIPWVFRWYALVRVAIRAGRRTV